MDFYREKLCVNLLWKLRGEMTYWMDKSIFLIFANENGTMYQFIFLKKVKLKPMFIIVHLKLFLFLSLIRIFFKGMGNFLETVLGIQILLARSGPKNGLMTSHFVIKFPVTLFLHIYSTSQLCSNIFSS